MYPVLLLSDFNEAVIFSKVFEKYIKYQISWKSSNYFYKYATACSIVRNLQTDFYLRKCNSKFTGEKYILEIYRQTASRDTSMYINQQDAQNSCDKTLFSIYALHVSDCISPSSGATFL